MRWYIYFSYIITSSNQEDIIIKDLNLFNNQHKPKALKNCWHNNFHKIHIWNFKRLNLVKPFLLLSLELIFNQNPPFRSVYLPLKYPWKIYQNILNPINTETTRNIPSKIEIFDSSRTLELKTLPSVIQLFVYMFCWSYRNFVTIHPRQVFEVKLRTPKNPKSSNNINTKFCSRMEILGKNFFLTEINMFYITFRLIHIDFRQRFIFKETLNSRLMAD